MSDIDFMYDDGKGNREYHQGLLSIKVDGGTVWEKPKPRKRIHPDRSGRDFWKVDGEYDLYKEHSDRVGGDHFYIVVYPATYE